MLKTEGAEPLHHRQHNYFKQDAVVQEGLFRSASMGEALYALNQGSQFAFYKMLLSNDAKKILSSMVMNQDLQMEINISQKTIVTDAVSGALGDLGFGVNGGQAHIIIRDTISDIVKRVLSSSGKPSVNLLLRTATRYSAKDADKRCSYWHIDKSLMEFHPDNNIYDRSDNETEKVFLLPLIGEPTLYQCMNPSERTDFLSMAQDFEGEFFYNSDSKDCLNDNGMGRFVAHNQIFSPEAGYGSVHLAGKDAGALHSAPYSSSGRFLLLIRPYG